MKIVSTDIEGVSIIEPQVFQDPRGWFMETYSRVKLAGLGIDLEFVQDNQSLSIPKGTLRGLHFQNNPKAQTKLVRCTKGVVLDVAVDIRRGSPTYGKWVAVELSADNKKQLFISKGFAHGFVTITDNCEVQYKVDQYYAPECDRSIRFDDPEIRVDWGVANPLISEKDARAPLLKDSDHNFSY
ncbi:MAG TPA: dTDP-4-dehydrorhamnose 3,5-epimerase [Firmicutes bacterium]|jgi:dTDP-4-dehydrorhamnose 3,5-epimerase|nr:dTDP-4-dehydrorhamnose 3,5-epimerase [Bacillota bacterium]